MSNENPDILEQFRAFYYQNKPENLEVAMEFFSVFGGLGWEVDTTKPLEDGIKKTILKKYKPLRNIISDMTLGDTVSHAVLAAAAQGDGKTHTSFKRLRMSGRDGYPALNAMSETGLISLEHSALRPPESMEEQKISEKVLFKRPFYQFWFALISPLFKGIQEGDYKEFDEKFANNKAELIQHTFNKLCFALLKKSYKEDTMVKMGSYWDREIDIDIIARTKGGTIIAGACKYSNQKMKKSDLELLKQKCEKAEVKADVFVLFSKAGFSNELKSEKSKSLRLFALKNFRSLTEDIEAREMIGGLKKEAYEG